MEVPSGIQRSCMTNLDLQQDTWAPAWQKEGASRQMMAEPAHRPTAPCRPSAGLPGTVCPPSTQTLSFLVQGTEKKGGHSHWSLLSCDFFILPQCFHTSSLTPQEKGLKSPSKCTLTGPSMGLTKWLHSGAEWAAPNSSAVSPPLGKWEHPDMLEVSRLHSDSCANTRSGGILFAETCDAAHLSDGLCTCVLQAESHTSLLSHSPGDWSLWCSPLVFLVHLILKKCGGGGLMHFAEIFLLHQCWNLQMVDSSVWSKSKNLATESYSLSKIIFANFWWNSWVSTWWSDFAPSPEAHQHTDLFCMQSAGSNHQMFLSPQVGSSGLTRKLALRA